MAADWICETLRVGIIFRLILNQHNRHIKLAAIKILNKKKLIGTGKILLRSSHIDQVAPKWGQICPSKSIQCLVQDLNLLTRAFKLLI